MAELENTIAGLEKCINNKGFCGYDCPYYHDPFGCRTHMEKDALELLKEQKQIIDQYKKADTFLAAHGWKWENTDG